MKKRICIMLCLSMIISVFSWYSSYATENVVADESELVAPQMPQYEPSAPDTAVSEMPTDFELPHSTNDLLNEETDEHNTDDEYRVIKTQSGEFLAIDIKTRDVEIYVTDGYVPIPGAVVTLNNIDKISNEHGKVKFYDVPTNDTAYTIDVNCESLGFAHAEIYLGNFDFLESEIDKISDVNFTISYWNIDIEESYSNISLIADASEGQWSQSLSVFPASVYSYFVSYDGKIFVFDESMFYIYNENNDMWAEQTSLSGTVKGAVEYNGNIYVLIDRRAGYYWHYYVDVYNISNKSWQKSKVDVNSRYDCAFLRQMAIYILVPV